MSIQDDIPGYVAGTWVIDAARSEAGFEVRQFGFSTVHGCFEEFEGTIAAAAEPRDSSVTAVLKAGSVNTKSKGRDNHLHKDDFLSVENHPTITFASTGVRADGASVLVDGDLTIRGVTKPVTLNVDLGDVDVSADSDGRPRARFSARTEIRREEFGVNGGMAAAVIGKKIDVILSVEAVKQN